ncbi:MAG TPA: polysaccharide deacetylase family protein [Trebonia sp.]|nr:polysaccharide deacetylase family protein [Trebonia sp.]
MTAASPPRVRALRSHEVPVLMYHEIADATITKSKLAVDPGVFADQMAYLSDAGFTSITAGELATSLAHGGAGLPERPVVVTFDDGYGDFYDHAVPLLKQHGLVATVFQTTGWVGLTDKVKRMMNWRELAEVAEAGMEVGAHTYRHPQLDQLSEKAAREELYGPKSTLEDKLGIAVPGIAYPFGYSNSMVRRLAEEAGYAYGYSVGNALTKTGADAFALPRLTVKRSTTMDSFRRMVNGLDTVALQRDRAFTRGYSVVRRAKSSVKSALSRSGQ